MAIAQMENVELGRPGRSRAEVEKQDLAPFDGAALFFFAGFEQANLGMVFAQQGVGQCVGQLAGGGAADHRDLGGEEAGGLLAFGGAAQFFELDLPDTDAGLGHGGQAHLRRVEGHVGHREGGRLLEAGEQAPTAAAGGPKADAAVDRTGGEQLAGGIEGQTADPFAVPFEHRSEAAILAAQEAHGAVFTADGDQSAVGRPGDAALPAAMDLMAGERFAGPRIPDHHLAIAASRGDFVAVGREP